MRTEPVIISEEEKNKTTAWLETIKQKVAVALVLVSAIAFFFKLLFF